MTNNDSPFFTLSTELLQHGHCLRFRPTGDSMYPTLRDGDPVLIEPIAPATSKCGDILLYRLEHRVIAHRVSAIQRRTDGLWFILRGDSLPQSDAPVAASQILGRVVAVERAGRTIDLTHPVTQLRQRGWAWLRRLKHRLTPVFAK